MKVTLNNGMEFEAIGVHGRTIEYQSASRDSLIFMFDPAITDINTVKEQFTSENCMTIALSDETGVHIHENYCLRTELGQGDKNRVIDSVSAAGVEVQEVVYVRMAQMSYTEIQLREQQEAIDALLIMSLEG